MSDNDWHDIDFLDDIEQQDSPERRSKTKGKERKRKWREIELIKEQRRLRRELSYFESVAL